MPGVWIHQVSLRGVHQSFVPSALVSITPCIVPFVKYNRSVQVSRRLGFRMAIFWETFRCAEFGRGRSGEISKNLDGRQLSRSGEPAVRESGNLEKNLLEVVRRKKLDMFSLFRDLALRVAVEWLISVNTHFMWWSVLHPKKLPMLWLLPYLTGWQRFRSIVEHIRW